LTAFDVLTALTNRDVILYVKNDRLFANCPRGELSAEDREVIATRKAELLELVRDNPKTGPAMRPVSSPPPESPPEQASNVRNCGQSPPVNAAPWQPRHPVELAGWPIPWREAWGCRANALDDLGLSCVDAEARAFAEVRAVKTAGGDHRQFIPAATAEPSVTAAAPEPQRDPTPAPAPTPSFTAPPDSPASTTRSRAIRKATRTGPDLFGDARGTEPAGVHAHGH
jgi:hypothetical protein